MDKQPRALAKLWSDDLGWTQNTSVYGFQTSLMGSDGLIWEVVLVKEALGHQGGFYYHLYVDGQEVCRGHQGELGALWASLHERLIFDKDLDGKRVEGWLRRA